MVSSSRCTMLLLLFVFIISAAFAAPFAAPFVGGTDAASAATTLRHVCDCDELLDMTIAMLDTPPKEDTCNSLGFYYRGGGCIHEEGGTSDCQDMKEPLNQGDGAYIVVSNVNDSSKKIYFQRQVQVGSSFQFSAPPPQQEESNDDFRRDNAFNITVYKTDDDLSFDNMIQTLIVKAPCRDSIPVNEGPVQLVFNAITPPTRSWQVNLSLRSSSSTDGESWTVEWVKSLDGALAQLPKEGVLLHGEDQKSIEVSAEAGLEQAVGRIHVTAQLVSNLGQRCIIQRTWDGAVSAS